MILGLLFTYISLCPSSGQRLLSRWPRSISKCNNFRGFNYNVWKL